MPCSLPIQAVFDALILHPEITNVSVRPCQVTKIPVHQSSAHFCFRNMNKVLLEISFLGVPSLTGYYTYALHCIVEIATVNNIALEQSPSLHLVCLFLCLFTSNQHLSFSGSTSKKPASFFKSIVV